MIVAGFCGGVRVFINEQNKNFSLTFSEETAKLFADALLKCKNSDRVLNIKNYININDTEELIENETGI